MAVAHRTGTKIAFIVFQTLEDTIGPSYMRSHLSLLINMVVLTGTLVCPFTADAVRIKDIGVMAIQGLSIAGSFLDAIGMPMLIWGSSPSPAS